MTRNLLLANRLREVFLNGRWIANTNFKELILSVTREQATKKMDGLNTIADLTYHVNYYLAGLLNAFDNGKLEISDKRSFDLPPIKTDADWTLLITTFLNNAQLFADKIERMDDSLFDQPFFDEKYGTYLRNIEGVIEHSYYHLGQVSLIKKLVLKSKT